jgi:hypothetical protein
VLIWKPSATSAIEPNIAPPAISTTIIAPVSAITAQTLRSL